MLAPVSLCRASACDRCRDVRAYLCVFTEFAYIRLPCRRESTSPARGRGGGGDGGQQTKTPTQPPPPPPPPTQPTSSCSVCLHHVQSVLNIYYIGRPTGTLRAAGNTQTHLYILTKCATSPSPSSSWPCSLHIHNLRTMKTPGTRGLGDRAPRTSQYDCDIVAAINTPGRPTDRRSAGPCAVRTNARVFTTIPATTKTTSAGAAGVAGRTDAQPLTSSIYFLRLLVCSDLRRQ